MSTNPQLSQVVLPITVEGTVQNITYDIKDTEAREAISALGHALYWIGVTTTALTDGSTTNPIIVNSEETTATLGGMASYSGSEFVWNGSAWQELGKNNFGDLAFKSSATGSFIPLGSVSITEGEDTTTSITPFGSAGTLPSMTVTGEVLTFNAGTLPSAGSTVDVVTASRTVSTAAFVGSSTSVTVS